MIGTLSSPAFYGYMAGKMLGNRREFMCRARKYDAEVREFYVKCARQYNRDYLKYIGLARKFS